MEDSNQKRSLSASSSALFYTFVVLLELLGLACIVLVFVWTKKYLDGFGWHGTGKEFDYHPVFMVIGMVVLFGNCKFVPT